MASKKSTVDFILEQTSSAGKMSAKKCLVNMLSIVMGKNLRLSWVSDFLGQDQTS